MKEALLTFCLSVAALCGMAQTQTNYNEKLVVTVNGISTDSIPAAITVANNGDGTCDFSLKNFVMVLDEDSMAVGNIDLKKVQMEEKDGISLITTDQSIEIQPGDDPKFEEDEWLGPNLGEVPIKLSGKLTAYALYVNIDIDMTSLLGQTINVVVGQANNVVSSINTTKVAPATQSTTIYTLNGLRVKKANKGMYIINGKKTIK